MISPPVLLPQEGVLDAEDLQDAELRLGDGFVEEGVNGPVAPVVTGYGHLQEVLAGCHGQPGLREHAGGGGGGGRERERERERHAEIHRGGGEAAESSVRKERKHP